MSDLTFEIKKKFGVIGVSTKGWKKELNLVSWDNRHAKLEIREWSEDNKKMGKGVTFSKDEVIKLIEILNDLDLSSI